MEICSSGHTEVCYECRHCPACEIAERLATAEDEATTEKERAIELQAELDDMKAGNE
jgi:hypothetical protein